MWPFWIIGGTVLSDDMLVCRHRFRHWCGRWRRLQPMPQPAQSPTRALAVWPPNPKFLPSSCFVGSRPPQTRRQSQFVDLPPIPRPGSVTVRGSRCRLGLCPFHRRQGRQLSQLGMSPRMVSLRGVQFPISDQMSCFSRFFCLFSCSACADTRTPSVPPRDSFARYVHLWWFSLVWAVCPRVFPKSPFSQIHPCACDGAQRHSGSPRN